jgi:glycosyltransferase involved in cell wall biosynthesis
MRVISFLCEVKVLLVHQHFKTPYTGGAIRSYYLAKALVDQGIRTIVITAKEASGYHVENVDGIEVHYLSVPYNNNFGFYRRGLAFMRFVWNAIKLSGSFRDADVCYAISVPLTVGIIARTIRSRFKIPYIFEVGDLWPDAPIQLGFLRSRMLQGYFYGLEKRIYHSAFSIVALSPAIKSAVEKKVPGKVVHLLPNISDTDFFHPVSKAGELEEKYGVNDKLVIAYIGAIGYANGLDHFFDCARECQLAALPVHFILCGEGALLGHLKQRDKQEQLNNFTFIPFQNREGVREILNVTDASFISYKPVSVLETGSPNKYFDGLAAGKMIIVNFGGWIKDDIEQNACGIYVDPRNAGEFPEKIMPFIQQKSLLEQYQLSARELAQRSYSRAELGSRFTRIIRSVAT